MKRFINARELKHSEWYKKLPELKPGDNKIYWFFDDLMLHPLSNNGKLPDRKEIAAYFSKRCGKHKLNNNL